VSGAPRNQTGLFQVPDDGGAGREDLRILSHLFELHVFRRHADELLERLGRAGALRPGLSAGRGATAAIGVGAALEPGDQVFGTHRDWPAAMARGGDFADVLRAGRATTTAAGLADLRSRVGGFHLTDAASAAHIAEAVGFGMACTLSGSSAIAVCLLGSGALMQPETTAALVQAVESRARVVFVLRGPRAAVERLVVIQRMVVSADSAYKAYWALAEARAARPGLPVLIDARWGGEAEIPHDAQLLRERGVLSPEFERTLAQEVGERLDGVRREVFGAEGA
jgi:TPP-dependent pyruvate/acetoin dehydrogenase alpha subunit